MEAEPRIAPPKRKRRWFQFSLRSLLIATVIVAIPCAWVGRKIEQKRKEREAVETIVKLGGEVHYDYVDGKPSGPAWLRWLLGENSFNEVVEVHLFSEMKDDAWANFKGMTQLRILYLVDARVIDARLANLTGLTQLIFLELRDSDVTDAGLANVRGLTQLQLLGLVNTHVTDAGLSNLSGLTQLQILWLDGTQVTDAGLVNFTGLTRLQVLCLNGTHVTDTGLANLKGLTQLQEIELSHTRVTDTGVAELQKALPNCKIYH